MAKYIKITKKGLDGDPRAEQIIQILERASKENYGESLWDSEEGLVAGARREVTKAIDICLEQNCMAEEIIDDIDDILFNLFGETLFEENKGLIYGSKQEVASEIENLLSPKSEDKMHYANDDVEVVDGIEFEMHDYHFEKFPRSVREVKRGAIIYFTQQNDFDGSDIKKVLCHDTYFDLESNNESKIKSGAYKLAMMKQVAQKNDGGSDVDYEYELVPVQKAKDLNMEDPEDILLDISQIVEEYKAMGSKLTMADRLETLEKIIEKFEK